MEKLVIGIIRTSHGLKGYLKVKTLSGETGHFKHLKEVFLMKNGIEKIFKVESVLESGNQLLIKLKGIDTPEEGKKYSNCEILVLRKFASHLEKNEYYAADLCKCDLIKKKTNYGKVKSIINGTANDLLEIESEKGIFIVPFIEKFIGKVNTDKKIIELKEDWMF